MVELRIKIISIHALREEGDAQIEVKVFDDFLFLSTPSARRATLGVLVDDRVQHISIHALREEGDSDSSTPLIIHPIFLSTPSARRATSSPISSSMEIFNFYPRPPRGGRLLRVLACTALFSISIHALREEGDSETFWGRLRRRVFLSTPSARRATRLKINPFARKSYFYPRPPRGGRRPAQKAADRPREISIHALREEGDSRE